MRIVVLLDTFHNTIYILKIFISNYYYAYLTETAEFLTNQTAYACSLFAV